MANPDLNSMTQDELIALVEELNIKLHAQKENSRKILQQDLFLRETLDILPAIFYSKRLDGSYLMVNKAYQNLFNWSNDHIINKKDHELFPKELADAFRKNDLEIINHQEVIETEELAIGDDGKEHFYHSFKFPYFDHDGKIWATGGISLEITEKKQFERQVFHNSKLASIGELAAGVGHEINNPLAIIVGHLTLLQKKMKQESVDYQSTLSQIEKCLNASTRISNIVNGLRSFARDDSDETQMFNVHEMLNESISMLEEIYSLEEVQIVHQHCKDSYSATINGNRGKVQQLFINLIANAKDATKGRTNRKISLNTKLIDNTLHVSVTDNGCGISPDIESRIFDPFFTTKEVNEGTGIGLGLVANIVKDHNGNIYVKSELNKGSTFTVELPVEKGS